MQSYVYTPAHTESLMFCYKEAQDSILPLFVVLKLGQTDWFIPDEEISWYMTKPLHTTKTDTFHVFIKNILYWL